MLAAIDGARGSIGLSSYILRDDVAGGPIIDARADPVRSAHLPDRTVALLEALAAGNPPPAGSQTGRASTQC